MMKISVLTLFPELFHTVLGASITGRAAKAGILDFSFVNIRDFSTDKHHRVDDYPYGAGGGMLMQPQPIYDAYQSLCTDEKPHVVFMSPQGKVFTQADAMRLSKYPHVAFLCGHYEGVDERVLEEIVDEELSLGNFVLTGGELAAMTMIDSLSRCIPGVLDSAETLDTESVQCGLMEYPQYTRPPVWHEKEAPQALSSGNHQKISLWRRKQMLKRTLEKRPLMFSEPDLLNTLDKSDIQYIEQLLSEK